MMVQIETKRLIIRQIEEEEYPLLYLYKSQSELAMMSGMKQDFSLMDTYESMRIINQKIAIGELFYWGIYLKDNQTLIGVISFSNPDQLEAGGEFGYFIGPEHQRKGYMKEAFKAVLLYLIKQGYYHFNLYIRLDNHISQAFAKAMEFKGYETIWAEDMAENRVLMRRFYRYIDRKSLLK